MSDVSEPRGRSHGLGHADVRSSREATRMSVVQGNVLPQMEFSAAEQPLHAFPLWETVN
ncbi:hypothetical protein ANANG_G00156550 [Anguilla anguilla]|uniref:Uncharacterized protein n=1 Tax=Anguilla anguilla TaxID=7936 RepID=A0A9D3RYJ7_ANGAN|nr:hypothetical protein ANANG_G00156550 [Anguilla anguilla]